MNKKIVKIILIIIIGAGLYQLLDKFPNETVIGLGIGIIILLGWWLTKADEEQYR